MAGPAQVRCDLVPAPAAAPARGTKTNVAIALLPRRTGGRRARRGPGAHGTPERRGDRLHRTYGFGAWCVTNEAAAGPRGPCRRSPMRPTDAPHVMTRLASACLAPMLRGRWGTAALVVLRQRASGGAVGSQRLRRVPCRLPERATVQRGVSARETWQDVQTPRRWDRPCGRPARPRVPPPAAATWQPLQASAGRDLWRLDVDLLQAAQAEARQRPARSSPSWLPAPPLLRGGRRGGIPSFDGLRAFRALRRPG
jgi:hypothetical protein